MTMFPSGRLVLPDNDEVPTLEDMAIGLANAPRFIGQTNEPWSVAEHQLGVALHIRAEAGRAGTALELYGAIHDAHECVTADIAHTWKTPDMSALQRKFDERLYRKYRLRPPTPEEEAEVKRFDVEALLAEAKLLTPRRTYDYICTEGRGLSAATEHGLWSVEQVRALIDGRRGRVASRWFHLVRQLMNQWELA